MPPRPPRSQETILFNGWPVGLVRAGVLHYVNPDHLGTPRSVVQASNNAEVWRWDSDPFGANGQTTAFMYNLRFPGQYYDEETGLHQNWMRDYDPKMGRYIQDDPTLSVNSEERDFGDEIEFVKKARFINGDVKGVRAFPWFAVYVDQKPVMEHSLWDRDILPALDKLWVRHQELLQPVK